MLQFFYDGYDLIYARRYEGQKVWHACTWFPELGTILIFLNTIVEKTYPEPWIYSFFVSMSCSKSPVYSSQNLQYKFLNWKSPFPLWNFSKNSSDLVTEPFPQWAYDWYKQYSSKGWYYIPSFFSFLPFNSENFLGLSFVFFLSCLITGGLGGLTRRGHLLMFKTTCLKVFF